MSMVVQHPVARYVLSIFEREHPNADGKIYSMGNVSLNAGEQICFDSPTLFMGIEVRMVAPKVSLSGMLEAPLRIVALNGLAIDTMQLRLKNVALTLLEGANFTIVPREGSTIKVENLEITRYQADALKQVKITDYVHLKDTQAFREYTIVAELLYRLKTEREIRNVIGLRPILV